MIWKICLTIVLVLIGVSVISAILLDRIGKKNNKVFTPLNILTIGVFISTIVGSFPVYYLNCEQQEVTRGIKSFFYAVHDTFQVFTLNSDVGFIRENITSESVEFAELYSLVMSILFVMAPIIIAGVVISFAKNFSSYLKFMSNYFNEVYVFSELNEKSLTLGKALMAKNTLIVYTDVFHDDEEKSYELQSEAASINAVFFKKDITNINFRRHKGKITFFMIGIDQSENIKQSLRIINQYKDMKDSSLYVFADSTESSIILSGVDKGLIKLRRIDEVQSLISRTFYERGNELFRRAVLNHCNDADYIPKRDERVPINTVVIGLGKYGTEMLKLLSWYCQMDGFRVSINAFEKDELAEEKLMAACPDLLSEKNNGVYIKGQCEYYIKVFSGMDVDTISFAKAFKSIVPPDYIFISLGDDSANIKAATYLRTLCEQMRIPKPIIQTVVYDTETKIALKDITIYDGKSRYDIDFIGDLEEFYSEKVIINSELESKGLACHMAYSQGLPDEERAKEEDKFWKYDYCYRSSIASALHDKIRKERKISPDTEDQLEHCRWSAYMRSEGYIYSGSPDKTSRNNLGKMHHNLVDFDTLPESDKQKDVRVSQINATT